MNRPGGLLPWAMWALGATFYCYAFFQRVAPAVMVPEMMREFAVGAAITGMLSGLYFYTYAGMQIPIGMLVDRYGSRRMLAAFALISGVGSALFAMAPGLGVAYAGRLLVGFGAAVTWVATLKLASQWFPPRRFALVTGLTLAMGMAGAVGGQAPLSAAVAAFGWRGTMWAAAIAAIALAAVLWLFVRDGAHPGEPAPSAGLSAGLKLAATTPQVLLLGLFTFTLAGPMLSFPGLWGVPYLMQVHGLDRAAAAFTTSAMLVGWGIGSPLAGWLSDRIGRRRPILVGAAVTALAFTLLALYAPGLPLAARQASLFVVGLAGGGFIIAFATARENAPAWAAGAVLALVNMCCMASGAVFQPLIGWLLDLNWDGSLLDGGRVYSAGAFAAALALLPASQALAILVGLSTRETLCRSREASPT